MNKLLHIFGLAIGLSLGAPSLVGAENSAPYPPLPEALSNNAVAQLNDRIYSFSGLGAGKTPDHITSSAWEYEIGADSWRQLPPVPGNKHRLASVAVGLNDRVFVIGGYTVDEGGVEVSTPEVYAFNPESREYQRRANIPIPVDDTVALAYANRYIYLVSGWHDDGNVPWVQLYDSLEDTWSEATLYPGTPVFGHAGGIVGNIFVISDGVGVLGRVDGRNQFGIVNESYVGVIDPDDPSRIHWQDPGLHPGVPRYRMAAMGDQENGLVIFAGGSDNAYNYNGIGYDGVPSEASAQVYAYDSAAERWIALPDKPVATMDHRGLLKINGEYVTVGGMEAGQNVSGNIHSFTIGED
jgi:hypothetical protein